MNTASECGYCHHPAEEPCEEASPGRPYLCTRVPGHVGPHVACTDEEHALAVWGFPVGRSTGPHVHHGAEGSRSGETEYQYWMRKYGGLAGGWNRSDEYPSGGLMKTIPESFQRSMAEKDERERLGRLVETIHDGGGTVQVWGVKLAQCDTYGYTAEERALMRQRDDTRAMAALWKETARRLSQERRGYRSDARFEEARADRLVTAHHDAYGKRVTAERERDEARKSLREAIRSADTYRLELAKADEQIRELNDEAQRYSDHITQPRPLTADDITDEMVERHRVHMGEGHDMVIDTGDSAEALRAAPTEPQRPEGAEGWDDELGEMPAAADLTPEQRARLADALAERDHALGVRVTDLDGHLPGCEGGPGRMCDDCGFYAAGESEAS